MTERGPVGFHFASLLRNLLAGARLALFLPVRSFDFRASPLDFVVLVAVDFAIWLLAAAARANFQGDFDPAAVPIYFAGVPLILLVAVITAATFSAQERTLLIATALIAS